MQHSRAILIAGPTASGKSALALDLAERLGGVVINADSMQVYRELSILTARPTAEDEARAPHALYGHVPAAEAYSAARFTHEAANAIAAARAVGRRPIVVGGTGLYFKALLEGLSPVPPVPDDVRAYWRAQASDLPPAALHAELVRRDPEMAARLLPSDRQRVTRALEVIAATGRSLAQWQRTPGAPVVCEDETFRVVIAIDPGETARRCDARFDAMLAAGALEEASALAALGLSPGQPAMRALGVPPLLAHIAGEIGREEAIVRAKAETRQFAKRQATWLRRYMISWRRVELKYTERFIKNYVLFGS